MSAPTTSPQWNARWEYHEQRSVERRFDAQPYARRGTLDDPDGPSEWDLR